MPAWLFGHCQFACGIVGNLDVMNLMPSTTIRAACSPLQRAEALTIGKRDVWQLQPELSLRLQFHDKPGSTQHCPYLNQCHEGYVDIM